MTLEEMLKLSNQLREEQQEEFMKKLVEMVENLVEKANKKDYDPTNNEREMFRQIYTIINDMNNWF